AAGPASASASPIGQDCVRASGSVEATGTGEKKGEWAPAGKVTQPWSPISLAVRVSPLGRLTDTVWLAESSVGLSKRRSARGATKKPSSAMAVASARPVIKTAEHKILANPAAECSRASPGGACHWLESSRGEAGCGSSQATTLIRAPANTS